MVGPTDIFYEWLPIAVESCHIKSIIQLRDINGVNGTVFVQQILIVLQPHVVVGDDEFEAISHRSANGKHAIVIQQTDKVAELHHPLCREMRNQASLNKSLLSNVVNDLNALALRLIDLDKPFQFAIVSHRIRIDKFLGATSQPDKVVHVITYHVAVEHTSSAKQ